MAPDQKPLSGRLKESVLNDRRVLEAARAVFLEDPKAPISAVAERAGVGMSAIYRRYPTKDALLQQLCRDGLLRYIAVAEAAWADTADPWNTLQRFMHSLAEANTLALTIRVAGTFSPTEELYRLAEIGEDLNRRIFDRARAAGVLRDGIEVDDLSIILEQLAAIALGDEARNLALRRRYLTLILDGFRAGLTQPLPGPAPTWDEVRKRWDR